jgi:hypothetical protein
MLLNVWENGDSRSERQQLRCHTATWQKSPAFSSLPLKLRETLQLIADTLGNHLSPTDKKRPLEVRGQSALALSGKESLFAVVLLGSIREIL